jgi:hypothetical protein
MATAENEVVTALLAVMNASLDEALASIRSARMGIRKNLEKIDAMQQAQAKQRMSNRI